MTVSSFITSSAGTPKRLMATALGLALLSGAPVFAAETESLAAQTPDTPDAADAASRSSRREETELDAVDVQGIATRAEPASPKYTAPLRDTPQTVSIVPQKVAAEQNLLSLRDVLSTLPGITFGAGEGGGGFGDSINLRGFASSTDIQADGVRDSAQYSRSDTFNLEQVEVVNGANSVYSGAGSVGGTINLVSKAARDDDFTHVTGAAGTDSYGRFTADTNHKIGESAAFRLNLMAHRNDAPGRDVETFKRWGFAPSIAFGLGSDTTFTLSYLHQKDDNIPQYGVPFFHVGDSAIPLPGLDPETYYGNRNVDTQEIEVDSFTAILQHTFNDQLSLRNFTRAQKVSVFTIVSAPGGTFCMPNNLTPTGASCVVRQNPPNVATDVTVPAGSWLPGGPRGNGRDTTNRMLVNQTDLTANFDTGAIQHTLVGGFSLMHESFELDGTAEFRNADGSNPYTAPAHYPFLDPYRPQTYWTGPRHRTLTSKTDGELDNSALYVFDNLKFNEQWSLNLGARYEHNEGSTTGYNVVQNAGNSAGPIGTVTGAAVPAKNSDDLFSYRAGVVFKPVEAGSIYLAYGNAKTPSKSSVNGTCNPAIQANITAGTVNCNLDPETAVNLELGTKWDLLDDRLSLTASVFRNDRKNYRVNDPGNEANPSGEQQLDGRARVDGVILGVSGMVTDKWAVYANYTYLDSEVLQGASDFAASAGRDYTRGDDLLSVPEHAFNLWTTMDVGSWQFGYGASYQGDFYVGQHSATNIAGVLPKSDAYWLHRAMVAWNVNQDFRLQLNVNNLFDKTYYTRIRTNANGWATPGDARQAVLSATYSF
ncbi:TonB-dependent receptor [Tahibacter amnicola]|uniref:TonB-dependent siderophore receptor n=1 Tax=Tahibacter amnicola TaxID=2976241 RepID=A0ABY6BDH1_9GAMM|nr:TonB-dependent siderophore receptor [Tahibacter amnicola]UXI67160.1 TonB-dependent siderophore receptor [Tahibacter amnicola]